MKYEIGEAENFRPGKPTSVVVGDVAVMVVRTPSGQFYALRDVCPHRQARLSQGKVLRALVADGVGAYALSNNYVVRCPYHTFEYDVGSGRCLADPDGYRVRTYKVDVVEGKVVIER